MMRSKCNCDICREIAARGGMTPQGVRQLIGSSTRENISKYGWCSHIVSDDPASPTLFNAHTHGFEDLLAHPDFQIVLPLETAICQTIFSTLFFLVQSGSRFVGGERYAQVIEGLEVLMLEAQEDGRDVLRVILPDPEDNLSSDSTEGVFHDQFRMLKGQADG